MLLLGRGAREIEGIQVFPDHENEKQFWYLSGPLRLSERNGDSVFTLIKYNKKAKDEGAKGGGFVTFEVNVGLPENIERRIVRELPDGAQLAAVPFDKGSVKCVALDVDEENTLGASSPTLYGDNSAIFSLTLNEVQAAIFEQTFKQAGQPIGVYYDLEFTAMRPTLDVKLSADLSRVYTEFQASLGFEGVIPAKVPFKLDAALEAGFQRLVQTGAIQIEVVTFVDDEDVETQKKEALKLFMDTLLKDWFAPTLKLPKTKPNDGDKKDEPLANTTPNPQEEETDKEKDNQEEAGLGEDIKDVAEAADDVAEAVIPQVRLRLKFVRQEELKKLTYRFSGSQATSRKYYPQGFFSRLLQDVDENKGIITVDVNDLFFETINIKVEAPQVAYETYRLQSVFFSAKYPDRDIVSLVFDGDNKTTQTASFEINKALDLSYSRQVQYNFLPDSGWDSELMTYEIPWETTEDRAQVLIPHKHIGFLNINASLERSFEWTKIQEVRLHLAYQSSSSNWRKEKVLQFTPDSSTEQHWKLRLNDPVANPEYTYYIEYVMEDGSTIDAESRTSSVPGIAVPDLTKGKLTVDVESLLDPTLDKRAFIDISYVDSDNDYTWEKTVNVLAGADPVEVQIPLMNSRKPEFEYKVTFVRINNETHTKAFPKAKYKRILLESEGTSELVIEITPEDINWDAVRLVSVDLLYQDIKNDIHETVSQKTLKKYDAPFEWTLQIADKSLTRYQWRATFYMRDSSVGNRGEVYYPAAEGSWETATTKFVFLDKYQPKEEKLEVEVSGEDIDWDEVEKVKVSLRYRDRINSVDKKETVTLDEDEDVFSWQVRLADATQKEYRWRARYYLENGKSEKTGWQDATQESIDLDEVLSELKD